MVTNPRQSVIRHIGPRLVLMLAAVVGVVMLFALPLWLVPLYVVSLPIIGIGVARSGWQQHLAVGATISFWGLSRHWFPYVILIVIFVFLPSAVKISLASDLSDQFGQLSKLSDVFAVLIRVQETAMGQLPHPLGPSPWIIIPPLLGMLGLHYNYFVSTLANTKNQKIDDKFYNKISKILIYSLTCALLFVISIIGISGSLKYIGIDVNMNNIFYFYASVIDIVFMIYAVSLFSIVGCFVLLDIEKFWQRLFSPVRRH